MADGAKSDLIPGASTRDVQRLTDARRRLLADWCKLFGERLSETTPAAGAPALAKSPPPAESARRGPRPSRDRSSPIAPDLIAASAQVGRPDPDAGDDSAATGAGVRHHLSKRRMGVDPAATTRHDRAARSPVAPRSTEAIRAAAAPDRAAADGAASPANAVRSSDDGPLTGVHLPPRARQILNRLLHGDGEKQIALALGISPHTVHTYVKQLHKTLGVSSRGELLARFVSPDARAR
ncbi:MAG TPA: LuxR C-terminal-related transcriptional regulator [Tepidisphaeraceae bacterium]|jgi:DNA-binding CsgD family transcriptional regulator